MEPHGVIYTKVFSADEEKDYENCELTETFILTDSSRVQFPATIPLDDSDTNTVKRKFEIDETAMDHNLQPPAKRTPGLLASVVSRYIFDF